MGKQVALIAVTTLSVALSTAVADARDISCANLPINSDNRTDGILLYRFNIGDPWQTLRQDDQLPKIGQVQFAYIVRELWDIERHGAIVIKSGSTSLTAGSEAHRNFIFLSRPRGASLDNGTCGPIKRFLPRYIASSSYDRYHDLGGSNLPNEDVGTLNLYHIHYQGRGGVCRDTNNISPDSPLWIDLRSNRSQFSFNAQIAARGMNSQLADSLGFGSAIASSAGLAKAKAEIRRYHTSESKTACIFFNLNITEGYFLRISDLDSSQRQGAFLRAYEKSWRLRP